MESESVTVLALWIWSVWGGEAILKYTVLWEVNCISILTKEFLM